MKPSCADTGLLETSAVQPKLEDQGVQVGEGLRWRNMPQTAWKCFDTSAASAAAWPGAGSQPRQVHACILPLTH